MIHTEIKPGDRYEIIVSGRYYRYTDTLEAAKRYAAQVGSAVVLNLRTGWLCYKTW